MKNATKKKVNVRISMILEELKKNGDTSVNSLAEMLGVSHMTVRRDIDLLESDRRITRFHGGVRLSEKEGTASYDLRSAENQNRQEKQLIAQRATSLINRGETVFLDAGTTTEMIAQMLPSHYGLTVVTAALNNINIVKGIPGTEVIACGGIFHESSGVFEGPEAIRLLSRVRIAKAFISANAVQFELGVTCSNQFEVAGKRAAMQSSLQKILVIDSSKLGHVVSAHFADISDFDRIITDLPDDAIAAECRRSGFSFDFVSVQNESGT